MAVNVEVEKTGSESNINLIKRFSRKVQGSGVLRKARSKRYKTRAMSQYTKNKAALRSLEKRQQIKKLIKLGKISDNLSRHNTSRQERNVQS